MAIAWRMTPARLAEERQGHPHLVITGLFITAMLTLVFYIVAQSRAKPSGRCNIELYSEIDDERVEKEVDILLNFVPDAS